MSKSTVKKLLASMDKAQIINVVMELYDARKEAKEYLEYFACPNESGKLEEYKAVIRNEFFPKRGEEKLRFSVCKKAISDYKKLHPSPENLADLMLCLVESASEFTAMYGDMWEQYYTSTETNFNAVMKFMNQHDIIDRFLPRIQQILEWSSNCGWGFCDSMPDIFYEYYQDESWT